MAGLVRLYIYDSEPVDMTTAVRDAMIEADVAYVDSDGVLYLDDLGEEENTRVLRSFGAID
jgi:hypothetical protein